MPRVSNAQTSAAMQANLNRKSEEIAKLQSQIASGQRMDKPSDDPVASARLRAMQSEQASLVRYNKDIGSVIGDLQIQEVHLKSSSDALDALGDLLLAASNGSNGAENLAAFASELSNYAKIVVDCFNAKDDAGNYLFSGTKTDTPAVRYSEGEYKIIGNSTVRKAVVGNRVEIDANVTAADLLGESPDLLNGLHKLVDGLKKITPGEESPKQLLEDSLAFLEVARAKVRSAIGDLGARQNMLQLMENINIDRQGANQRTQDGLAKQDMTEAILKLRNYEVSMQASQKVYSLLAKFSPFELI
ncbi:flagellar hook-associated protein FlgL [Pseudomonas plecoglossicida]|uniref:Flagellar hook-associated protein 3 n=1 Tax=Pseudomonas plecoglossicida TaxID=70775 RepID=A0AAD0R6R4_PSEDL|nr:flagellar hook-associated protein FlgL [Pseudomonas plecoglossicida]AXM98896.1 flagellar hook-associated protein 3 [Pseudomonas plecoglossicida]QLB55043.1 flagellar hook-associated protein 3 [Pseudomonas plecoglossicida]